MPFSAFANIARWAGSLLSPASGTAGDGTQTGPVVRPIQRKYVSVSTNVALGANAVFTSPWIDTQQTGANFITLQCYSNQASASPGPILQGTNDPSNANLTVLIGQFSASASATGGAIAANTLGNVFAFCPYRYYRASYTNGATAQASLSLTVTEQNMPPGMLFAANTVASGAPTGLSAVTALPTGGALTNQQNLLFGASAGGDGTLVGGAFASANSAYGIAVIMNAVTDGGQNNNNSRIRTPNKFNTAQATASGNTAVWTPTSGKKFRLMRFLLDVTNNASQAAGGVITFAFQDGTSALNIAFDVFVPTAAVTTVLGGYTSGWCDLGNGFLSAAANNVLNINLSATLATGNVRVTVAGCEE